MPMEWRIQKQDKDRVARLAEELACSRVLAWVLLNRGYDEPERARQFLNPTLDQLRPRQDMADMGVAVERIARAVAGRETIGVHGDYDADGLTGAAILIRFFRELGLPVVWHIPHRQREGYGIKPAGIERLQEQGASLLITVDCGVTEHEAIGRAVELGLDVIIVDHHQIPERLPPALAVINAQRADCPFQGQQLSGAGTAFYLASAVRAGLRERGLLPADGGPNLLQLLDLVALGTIADVVPLTGLNRVLVHFGLDQINRCPRPAIIQLRRVAGLLDRPLGPGQVSFSLAPRLNAAGRVDSGEAALALLLTDEERQAGLIAEQLDKLNHTRQVVEERILTEALARIERAPALAEGPALVVAGVDWHPGVIGIVASRLVDQFHLPAAVISIHEGVGKGSLRSVAGVNLFTALKTCAAHLIKFGGHTMAAGITLSAEAIPAFTAAFSAAVHEQVPQPAEPVINVDAEWPIARCDDALVTELARLQPHGVGNPEPRFCARGALVKWAREGRKNTLLLGLEEQNLVLRAFGFGLAHRIPSPGARLDVIYTPVLDTWNGQTRLELKLRDFVEV
jgi:single-stranded-DNA-specific exonuclease